MGNKYINRVSTIEQANNYLKNKGIGNITCLNYAGNLRGISSFKCNIDNYEWSTSLDNVGNKSKCGCPKCANHYKTRNIEEVNSWLKDNNRDIVCLFYACTTANKNSKFKCLKDGYEWTTSFRNIKNIGRGCAVCANVKKIKHIEEVNEWLKNNDKSFNCIKYAGNIREQSLFHCNVCNREWESNFNNIKNGNGCPHCSSSKGEQRVAEILDKYNIIYDRQVSFEECKNILPLPFDFGVYKNNKLIFLCEYQGIQHYEPVDFASKGKEWAKEQFEINHNKDILKKDFCKNNNIPLLEIPYWEFDNIENIILNFIKEAA